MQKCCCKGDSIRKARKRHVSHGFQSFQEYNLGGADLTLVGLFRLHGKLTRQDHPVHWEQQYSVDTDSPYSKQRDIVQDNRPHMLPVLGVLSKPIHQHIPFPCHFGQLLPWVPKSVTYSSETGSILQAIALPLKSIGVWQPEGIQEVLWHVLKVGIVFPLKYFHTKV